MAEPAPHGEDEQRDEQEAAAAAPQRKKRRAGGGGERHVPPPRRLRRGVSFGAEHFAETSCYVEGGLRKVRPYYFEFRTYCKGRWVGRRLAHVLGAEFRARPLAAFRAAARAGRLRLNEEPVRDLDAAVLKNNDLLRNTVHRHEPPVTAQPIQILVENDEVVVVDKPSSLPVHPCGRFRHNTVIFILGKEHNLKELHTIHRLDRMTSGVLMFAKTAEVSKRIDEQVRQRQVRAERSRGLFHDAFLKQVWPKISEVLDLSKIKFPEKPLIVFVFLLHKLEKEYVCRVVGEFPENEVVCEEPILVVSYKVGVCRVDPKGKPCKTVFQRLSYNGKTSVVRCLPYTGRTHQIRVHLQYLGYPIVNDPIYNMKAWGPERGKGGKIDKTNDELLQALVEEHRSKQSLDVLGISEEDWDPGTDSSECGNSGDCRESVDPVNGNPCPAEDTTDPGRGEIPTRLQSCDTSLGSLESDKKSSSCEGLDGAVGKGGAEEKDPLCLECQITRQDPSPGELVMYLHALRYKGTDFEYCSKMPPWALEDWQESEEL